MDIINTGTASLDLLFMTTEERIASDTSRILKKLINYILDHLDDKQAPPSIQELWNDTFARGFQAGYRKAYQQWGEEVEERMDEAYNGGIADERKWWKGKQTTEPRSEPTKTTATTVETASQTNDAPKRRCTALQTEPPKEEDPNSLKNAQTTLCVEFGMQTTMKTTEATTQTKNEPSTLVASPHSPANAATSPLMMPTQPPSMMATSSPTTATTSSPAPNQSPAPRE
jgi:hypothetical protein